MEKGTWKITLADGTVLDGLRISGNNFIADREVKASDFDGKLGHVTIEGPEGVKDYGLRGEHSDMELVQVEKYADGWYFILRDLTPEELRELKMRGDIEYIAMMTGIDLE